MLSATLLEPLVFLYIMTFGFNIFSAVAHTWNIAYAARLDEPLHYLTGCQISPRPALFKTLSSFHIVPQIWNNKLQFHY